MTYILFGSKRMKRRMKRRRVLRYVSVARGQDALYGSYSTLIPTPLPLVPTHYRVRWSSGRSTLHLMLSKFHY
jgi:hypothetical protein